MNHGTFLYFKNQEDYRLHITNASHTLKKLVAPSTLQQLAPTLIIPPPFHHGHLSWEIPLVMYDRISRWTDTSESVPLNIR